MTPTNAMSAAESSQWLKSAARETGFALVGITAVQPAPGFEQLVEWIERGYSGEMDYFRDRLQAYRHPDHVLAGTRSIVLLGTAYLADPPSKGERGCGRVSRYAWNGQDYHDVIRTRMCVLANALAGRWPHGRFRSIIDTAPLPEREFAALAGLGWQAKNTLLLNRDWGSWFFLSAILTDVELQPDEPFAADHCGTCTACLDACPTQAFVGPRLLNATRCISYLTIEQRGPIPNELRESLGNWVFGCDVCQDVCPWNSKVPAVADPAFQSVAELNPLELAELFYLDEAAFRARFRHTPLWRPRRSGILRNAAIVLGNQRHLPALPALLVGLNDPDPVVRGASAWALGRFRTEPAYQGLRERQVIETDLTVHSELIAALSHAASSAET
jgi:epoxyqueuosine reductase